MQSVGSSSTGWNGARKIPLRSLMVIGGPFDSFDSNSAIYDTLSATCRAASAAHEKYFTFQSTFAISHDGPTEGAQCPIMPTVSEAIFLLCVTWPNKDGADHSW